MKRVVRWSEFWVPTLKETPQEALIKSHRLMLRAGLVRKLASGTYSYLPLGLRALKKAETIVREEMDRAGALELLLPALHPLDLWQETGRDAVMGEGMFRFRDRHGKWNVLGPTHEEIITDLARREIHSYKQLPVTLYQIQTKFRDEARPRSGVIRSREFVMKDAYSFHETAESLDATYNAMRDAYCRVFSRCGLTYYVVQADPGAMGGSGSQEFVLFSDAGEDRMARFGDTDVVMSVEMAPRRLKGLRFPSGVPAKNQYTKVHTPGHSSVEGVAHQLRKTPQDLVKTMIFQRPDKSAFAVLVRGDHEVSEFKIKKSEPGAVLASRDCIESLGSAFGFSGPFGLSDIKFYIDEDVLGLQSFVTGANEADYHFVGVEIEDLAGFSRPIEVGDYRQAVEGDRGVLDGRETELHFRTAIELGHIFKLNLRYSSPMKAEVLDASGRPVPMVMGCYGIGVNRILAAAIEEHADDKGIAWPKNIAPFQIEAVLIDPKDEASRAALERFLADPALPADADVLVDDRPDSAGIKFNDADLIGCPLRVIFGPKNLKNGQAEIKLRKSGETALVALQDLARETAARLDKLT